MDNPRIYTLKELKEILMPILKEYGVKKSAIFGSYARNSAKEKSDIDLLVYLDETFDLEKYLDFEETIKNALKKHVDIIEYRCINRMLKDEILREAVEIYGIAG